MSKRTKRTETWSHGVSRRHFLLKAPTVAGMGAMACVGASGASTGALGQRSVDGENYSGAGVPSLVLDDSAAVVETAYGRVRGFIRNGIRTFRGIPYAGDPTGENRFMPPTKPTSWTGVRSSLYWGPCCPQVVARRDNDEIVFFGNPPAAEYREDCQRLNVWTPGLDNAKRPVMVWMHGGGFTHGCAQLCFYDGENLAHRGNVVVVSLTHRLNALGFLNLASFSSKYADSANVGVMDLVAALAWVRENIASFGGNPDEVMIFGESGGGSKVLTTLTMPSAKGLAHRAAVQSGAGMVNRYITPDQSAETAANLMKTLNISPARVDDLQKIPVEQLIAAVARIGVRWGPTVDGRSVPIAPFNPTAPEISKDVPLLVGSNLNESAYTVGHPELEEMTEAEAKDRLSEAYGDGETVYGAFLKAYPASKPYDVYSVASAASSRQSHLVLAERKTAQGGAPAYNYLFSWKPKILNGRPRAFHMAEISFVFYTTELSEVRTGATDEAQALAAKMCDCWVSFARSGDPNHTGIPHWPVYDPQTVPTMVFDDVCTVERDPVSEARRLIARLSHSM